MTESSEAVKDWEQLTVAARRDLTVWVNLTPIDDEEKSGLAELFNSGRFGAWDCPSCKGRCYYGDPKDWRHFQGVCQVDYISYPPSEKRPETWCDTCRAQGDWFDQPQNVVGVPPWDQPAEHDDHDQDES